MYLSAVSLVVIQMETQWETFYTLYALLSSKYTLYTHMGMKVVAFSIILDKFIGIDSGRFLAFYYILLLSILEMLVCNLYVHLFFATACHFFSFICLHVNRQTISFMRTDPFSNFVFSAHANSLTLTRQCVSVFLQTVPKLSENLMRNNNKMVCW